MTRRARRKAGGGAEVKAPPSPGTGAKVPSKCASCAGCYCCHPPPSYDTRIQTPSPSEVSPWKMRITVPKTRTPRSKATAFTTHGARRPDRSRRPSTTLRATLSSTSPRAAEVSGRISPAPRRLGHGTGGRVRRRPAPGTRCRWRIQGWLRAGDVPRPSHPPTWCWGGL